MGSALALWTALWVTAQAASDLELGLRLDGRTSRSLPRDAPAESITTGTVTPAVGAWVEDGGLRAAASYALRLWSGDAVESSAPRLTQTLGLRCDLRSAGQSRLELTATGLQGRTDPLVDPFQSFGPGGMYVVAAPGNLPYQSLRAGARGELPLDERTTAGAGVAWSFSRGQTLEA